MVVIGSGLVGTVLATFLARQGHEVQVYDRVADPRAADLSSGRSINLTLCDRGFAVLDSIGVGNAVREVAVPVMGRLIHDIKGDLTFQPYGNKGEAIHSIARTDLNKVLLDFASRNYEIGFAFNQKCRDIDFATPSIQLENIRSGRHTSDTGKVIFGCDGAYSVVRSKMQRKMRLNFSQQYWNQGYKELRAFASSRRDWTSEQNVIHIWPRKDYMLIGFPNIDGSITCSLHLPFSGPLSFESLMTAEDVRELFRHSFPDVIPHMPDLIDDFLTHPANPMITIKCSPWSYTDRVVLIGDAAHSIYPSYGQGANAGFEDCATLSECMQTYREDWKTVLSEFERRRRPNTNAIADLCVEHFKELRDLVGSPEFLLRKEIERKINQTYPDKYKDLYSMITFTCMPYVEAMRIDREQRTILDQLMAVDNIGQKLHSPEINGLIDHLMAAR
jgi:kynurenine 3-monooxygenase